MSRTRIKVKEVAKAKGVSQAWLGRAANLSVITIRLIYKNPYRKVVYDTLHKLAQVLEVKVEDLIEEVPEEKGEEK